MTDIGSLRHTDTTMSTDASTSDTERKDVIQMFPFGYRPTNLFKFKNEPVYKFAIAD